MEESVLGDKELVEMAREAREYSYSPYSDFGVGAALRTSSNTVFTGCNIENSSYGLTNCAERTALFKAVSEGERDFNTLALVGEDAENPVYPCGSCRQVLVEFETELSVITVHDSGDLEKVSLHELLPHSFQLDKENI